MEFFDLEDPRLWVSGAFVFFFALIYKKMMKGLGSSLDKRSAAIKSELDAARELRQEAERLLADYKQRQAQYEKEAEAILVNARKDADQIGQQAQQELKIALDARMKSAMDKIAQEEEKAIADVRNHVVDIALAAARSLIVEQVSSMPQEELIKLALSDIERKIH